MPLSSSIIAAVRAGAIRGSSRASRSMAGHPKRPSCSRRCCSRSTSATRRRHLGAFDGDELVEHWRFQTRAGATGDELAERIAGLLALSGGRARLRSRRSSSPRWSRRWAPSTRRWPSGTSTPRACMVGPGRQDRDGDPDRQPPRGRRRPARQRGRRVRPLRRRLRRRRLRHRDQLRRRLRRGEYLGGAIAPGVEISLTALTERGARIPRIDLAEPERGDRQVHAGGDPVRA